MEKTGQNPNMLRAFASVDLAQICHNFDTIKNAAPKDMKMLAVVKAGAYGHDAEHVARALKGRASYFGVATATEGIALRRFGTEEPILIFGRTPLSQAPLLAEYGLTQCVFSFDYANELALCLASRGLKAKIHIKIDTGMGRLGFRFDAPDTLKHIQEIARLHAFEVEGIFSHYAKSDAPDDPFNALQYSRFRTVIDTLKKNGLEFPYRHISNSAACIFGNNEEMTMGRIGLCLYGDFPSNAIHSLWDKNHPDTTIAPAMKFNASVAQLRTLKTGDPLGYDCSFIAPRDTLIAVIAAGYADGIIRSISGKADAIAKGCRIVGNICMDITFVDITDLKRPINEGDIVPLFGENGITALDWAHAANTIPYEIYCNISARVPRVMFEGDRFLEIV